MGEHIRRLWGEGLLQWSIGLVLVWRIVLEAVNQVVANLTHQTAINQWANWDGGWYLSINNHGYSHVAGVIQQENVAFFPAFPETVGFFAKLLHTDFVVTGLVINTLLTIACVYVLMKIAQVLAVQLGAAKQRHIIAVLSGLGLLVYPASFFFAAYYAEAILVLGVLGAVYFALTKRILLAVPFITIATASKVMGIVALVAVLAISFEQWWREKAAKVELAKRWLIAGLGLGGLLSFMVFLWTKFGDPLLFYHIQQAWGRNDRPFFLTGILKNYLHSFDPAYFGSMFYYLVNVVIMLVPFAVAAVAFVIWRRYKLWWPAVLGLVALVMPLSTGIMDSLHRYCLVAAPLIPLAIIWFKQQNRLTPFLLYASLVASGLLMLFFAQGFLRGDFAG